MKNTIATNLENLYNNHLTFEQVCKRISNSLLTQVNKEIYDKFRNKEIKNGSYKN